MKQHWSDHKLWIQLAKVHGTHLTNKNLPADTKNIRRICKKLNLTMPQFQEWCGTTLFKFQKLNPDLPAFALHGQLLEMIYEKDIMAGKFNQE